ncbi:hypothetical protein TRIP_B350407 [uncultured Desulfatiglans sp.]|nr:hypothetical protein TRIP_B350407 [uncultured Desulfatiglans sp.]
MAFDAPAPCGFVLHDLPSESKRVEGSFLGPRRALPEIEEKLVRGDSATESGKPAASGKGGLPWGPSR